MANFGVIDNETSDYVGQEFYHSWDLWGNKPTQCINLFHFMLRHSKFFH